jgi:hypothetical protein
MARAEDTDPQEQRMNNPYFLHIGAHDPASGERCAMEWVSWIAGEDHSDSPACVSPILAGFCRSLNDVLPDDTRQRMRPYLARCIGTAGDGLDEQRGYLCLDWIVRTYTPAWLALAGLGADAERLRSLAPITDLASARLASPVVREAREKAAAARDATAAAARDATEAAAWDAAWDAAWAAARAAARDALAPTVRELQASAFDLLDRMLPTVTVTLPDVQATRAAVVCEA